jgi:hypothetical protein
VREDMEHAERQQDVAQFHAPNAAPFVWVPRPLLLSARILDQ